MGTPDGLSDGGAQLRRTAVGICQENRAWAGYRPPIGATVGRQWSRRKEIERSVLTSRHRSPGLEGGGERSVVQIIQFAPDRHALGKPSDPDVPAGEAIRYIVRGGLALDGRVQCQDQLLTRAKPGKKPLDIEIVRADAVERRQSSAQDVISSVKSPGSLDSPEIREIFDHT